MVDRLAARHSEIRRPRRGAEPISDPVLKARPHAPSETGSALAIVHARYDRELALAATGEPADRAGALAEARRLVKVAVALRAGRTIREVDEIARVPAQRRHPDARDS